jgi:type VI secretion system protein ImpM
VPGLEAGVTGLYGKLPARGDFLSRRLDPQFIERWDAWLQRVMAESREALGERWLECFLSAPVWRFVLPAGMVSKLGWTGVLVPSVDRVGRYFPLTLAAGFADERIDAPSTLGRLMSWLDALERLALEALGASVDVDAFDQRLCAQALPEGAPLVAPQDDDTVPLDAGAFQAWPLRADVDMQEILQRGALGRRTATSVWATRGGEHFAPCIAACGDWIPGGHFCALLDGRWTEHGWTSRPSAIQPEMTTPSLYCDAENPGVDFVHGQGKEGGAAPPLAASPSSTKETHMRGREEDPSP